MTRMLGVITLLGTELALGAIRYINVDPIRPWTTFIAVPGLYQVSLQMLKRDNRFIARALNPGNRDDKRKLVGFESSHKYKYIGMNSGTNALVQNALCEGWLNRNLNNDSDVQESLWYVDSARGTTILKAEITFSTPATIIKYGIVNSIKCLLLVCIQVASLYIFYLTIKTKNVLGIVIMFCNMFCNFLINVTIGLDTYSTPNCSPTAFVPVGNALITNEAGTKFMALVGTEVHIQNFLQQNVVVQNSTHNDLIAPIFGIMTGLANILVLQFVTSTIEKYYVIALFLGTFSNMLSSAQDGDIMLEALTNKYYLGRNDTIFRSKIKYTNRASALAAVVLYTHGKSINLNTLVPITDEYNRWKYYRIFLNDIQHALQTDILNENLRACTTLEGAIFTLCRLFPESAGQLYPFTTNNYVDFYNRFEQDFDSELRLGIRLIVDILEAMVDYNGWTQDEITFSRISDHNRIII